jgi:hypothetical protein
MSASHVSDFEDLTIVQLSRVDNGDTASAPNASPLAAVAPLTSPAAATTRNPVIAKTLAQLFLGDDCRYVRALDAAMNDGCDTGDFEAILRMIVALKRVRVGLEGDIDLLCSHVRATVLATGKKSLRTNTFEVVVNTPARHTVCSCHGDAVWLCENAASGKPVALAEKTAGFGSLDITVA